MLRSSPQGSDASLIHYIGCLSCVGSTSKPRPLACAGPHEFEQRLRILQPPIPKGFPGKPRQHPPHSLSRCGSKESSSMQPPMHPCIFAARGLISKCSAIRSHCACQLQAAVGILNVHRPSLDAGMHLQTNVAHLQAAQVLRFGFGFQPSWGTGSWVRAVLNRSL